MKNQDDYLWDPGAEAEDSGVQDLERALAPAKWSGELPDDAALEARGRKPRASSVGTSGRRAATGWALALAASIVALLAWGPSVFGPESGGKKRPVIASLEGTPYLLEVLAGSIELGGELAGKTSRPALGELILTGPDGSAVLTVPGLGTITLEANTALSVVDPTQEASSRYESAAKSMVKLERGAFRAVIIAAPGAFQVSTPAGLSVDLGCAYRAEVDETGLTSIAVTIGRVAFEGKGRRVFVPAGASIHADPNGAPSTPIMESASDRLREYVAMADADGDLGPTETSALISASTPSDAITLLHLIHLPNAGPELLEHLTLIEPPPFGIDPKRLLEGDEQALEAWMMRL